MFKRILVALDRSEMGEQIFKQGLALAKSTGATLLLLHVLSSEEEGSPYVTVFSNFNYYPGIGDQTFEFYQKQWNTFKNEGIEMLQSFCAKANEQGIETEFTQNFGSPGRIICDLASNWNADLIIMGRRGHSGLKELFLGSVSNYVLHHAPCSVHIVHLSAAAKEAEVKQETTTAATVE